MSPSGTEKSDVDPTFLEHFCNPGRKVPWIIGKRSVSYAAKVFCGWLAGCNCLGKKGVYCES